MLRRIFSTLIVLATLTGAALAQQTQPLVSGTSTEPPLPKPLAAQKKAGAQLYYLGRHETLDGWAMVREGQPEFYYATTDGKAVLMGFLFDGDGNLLTGDQLKKIDINKKANISDMMAPKAEAMPAVPAPDAATPPADAQKQMSAGDMLFNEMQGAASILYGQANVPKFHAFINPDCSHCQQFLREMEPSVTAGVAAVRIIPVGSDDKTMRQAAFALASADGGKRFADYAKGDAAALSAPEGVNVDAISNNGTLMRNWNLDATPIIVYKAAGTGEVKIIRGRPLDMAAALADLTGQK